MGKDSKDMTKAPSISSDATATDPGSSSAQAGTDPTPSPASSPDPGAQPSPSTAPGAPPPAPATAPATPAGTPPPPTGPAPAGTPPSSSDRLGGAVQDARTDVRTEAAKPQPAHSSDEAARLEAQRVASAQPHGQPAPGGPSPEEIAKANDDLQRAARSGPAAVDARGFSRPAGAISHRLRPGDACPACGVAIEFARPRFTGDDAAANQERFDKAMDNAEGLSDDDKNWAADRAVEEHYRIHHAAALIPVFRPAETA